MYMSTRCWHDRCRSINTRERAPTMRRNIRRWHKPLESPPCWRYFVTVGWRDVGLTFCGRSIIQARRKQFSWVIVHILQCSYHLLEYYYLLLFLSQNNAVTHVLCQSSDPSSLSYKLTKLSAAAKAWKECAWSMTRLLTTKGIHSPNVQWLPDNYLNNACGTYMITYSGTYLHRSVTKNNKENKK